ncbi:glycosyltransferase family 2 protein [Billgrantia sp. LNSP4103-1]|uniref:glycosyltransferase family 2 protein n=1 Tax=Billgrantia sp. LNSP4103-1 TaxID=3410266 RepID=UPI00403F07B0
MNSNPTISIIIPVYGVENYISKCLASIKQQTFADFEAILINDGTKDNSITVAKEAIAGDERFIIIHKENGGQGSARNLGLDYSRGEYIAFIDSDDYVEPRFLQAMYEELKRAEAEVCVCNAWYVSETGEVVKTFRNQTLKFLDEKDVLNADLYISNWMCDKLFSKKIFQGVRFDPSVKTFEDAHLLFRLVYNRKLAQTDEFLYHYVQRKGSTTHGLKPGYLKDRMAVTNIKFSFAKKIELCDSQYLNYVYLKVFVFPAIVTFARYSKHYLYDIKELKTTLEPKRYNLKNIMKVIKRNKKVGVSLLFFKASPRLFRLFVRYWFQGHEA